MEGIRSIIKTWLTSGYHVVCSTSKNREEAQEKRRIKSTRKKKFKIKCFSNALLREYHRKAGVLKITE